MTAASNATFAEPWRQLWNGDLAQLDAIVAEDFVAHAALMGGVSRFARACEIATYMVRAVRII